MVSLRLKSLREWELSRAGRMYAHTYSPITSPLCRPPNQTCALAAAWPSLIDGFVTWAQEKPKDYQPKAVGGDDEGMDQS